MYNILPVNIQIIKATIKAGIKRKIVFIVRKNATRNSNKKITINNVPIKVTTVYEMFCFLKFFMITAFQA